uniref:Uncharacterized protein n=1 Tax=Sphaerodactylus townsendi TaxID=933632 RepID=A0ACB8EC70_9SAUR
MGLVLEKDGKPCDPDSGDEKDVLIPDQHDPPLGAARSTSGGESMGLLYSWVPSQRPCWGSKAAGQRASTWLMQPIDQDIYSEWDPVGQSLHIQDPSVPFKADGPCLVLLGQLHCMGPTLNLSGQLHPTKDHFRITLYQGPFQNLVVEAITEVLYHGSLSPVVHLLGQLPEFSGIPTLGLGPLS